jgi:alkaline phosphatase
MTFTLKLAAGAAAAALLAGSACAADKATLTQSADPYFAEGQATLKRVMEQKTNTAKAKNIILFVGDGMSLPTVTAARIFEGQKKGMGDKAETNLLSFEKFPYSALSETYTSDGMIADSAPTAAAMMTGIKSPNGTIGVTSAVKQGDCKAGLEHSVPTMLEMAETAGLSTGVITTARLTHATPAATYAHTAHRDWEADKNLPEDAAAAGCKDIARQLIESPYGNGLEVAMGGGRTNFIPATMDDPEDAGKKGVRKDGRDLTAEWVKKAPNSAYVWNKTEFDAIDVSKTDHLLGLFNRSHMEYEADIANDKAGEPDLAAMTTKSIELLSKNQKGFFLMVEAGRIDHAHHEGNAYRALEDTVELSEAVKAAMSKVNLEETLIIVTADHSHTFSISGYADRGTNILGLATEGGKVLKGDDDKPYTILGYMNGPGATKDGARADLSNVDTTAPDFLQQSLVPMSSETHAGDDVGIFAVGPWAHLFQGTVGQQYIFHVMDYASKISEPAASL